MSEIYRHRNHYDYLEAHFEENMEAIRSRIPEITQSYNNIAADGDKCYQYMSSRSLLKRTGLDKHQIAFIYLLSHHPYFSDSVRRTTDGWIPVEDFIHTLADFIHDKPGKPLVSGLKKIELSTKGHTETWFNALDKETIYRVCYFLTKTNKTTFQSKGIYWHYTDTRLHIEDPVGVTLTAMNEDGDVLWSMNTPKLAHILAVLANRRDFVLELDEDDD